MTLMEDFFIDAEEVVEIDLPTAKEQANHILSEWKNRVCFNSVVIYENRQIRTDQDTYFLAQLDDKALAKILETHYRETTRLHRSHERTLNKAKEIEEVDDLVRILLEDLGDEE